jgi:hypothetical protein
VDPFLVEDGEQAGAGVLGVDVDGAGAQGAERDLRRPQSRAALDRQARIFQHLGEGLGQEVGLGEGLGGHHHRLLSGEHEHDAEHGCHARAVSRSRRT